MARAPGFLFGTTDAPRFVTLIRRRAAAPPPVPAPSGHPTSAEPHPYRGMPLPKDDPRRRQTTGEREHRLQPLRVIHLSATGEWLGEETLAVTPLDRADGAKWG